MYFLFCSSTLRHSDKSKRITEFLLSRCVFLRFFGVLDDENISCSQHVNMYYTLYYPSIGKFFFGKFLLFARVV